LITTTIAFTTRSRRTRLRRAALGQTHAAITPRAGRCQHAAKRSPARRYPARIARQLALAHALRRRLERGEFANFADMARELGFTRARVTQLMDLLLLAPEVQEEILFLELPPGAQPVSELGLREAVLGTIDWQEQRRRWEGLRAQFAPSMLNRR
jgi:hypothetical protein